MDIVDTEAGRGAEKRNQLTVKINLLALWSACRPWAFRSTMLLVSGMAFLAWQIKFHAESNLLSVFLAYFPAWVTALPLLTSLFVGCLFLCWRSIAMSLAIFVWVVFWLGSYRVPWRQPAYGNYALEPFSVLTYNQGQGSERVLANFAAQSQPDVAVFQDASRRLSKLAAMPQFAQHRHAVQDGEYVLLSRWPVLQNESLQLIWPEKTTGLFHAGTRSVIDWNGRRVIFYNIHLPTPRDLLYWYGKNGTFIYGIIGIIPNTELHKRHQLYLETWRNRVSLVSQLASRVRQEQEPVILLGDLNLPPAGHGYNELCGVLQDAHFSAGTGYGHTFPGNLKSLAGRFAPWIRIDHIFVSSSWEVQSMAVFGGGGSQHLPVCAILQLKK